MWIKDQIIVRTHIPQPKSAPKEVLPLRACANLFLSLVGYLPNKDREVTLVTTTTTGVPAYAVSHAPDEPLVLDKGHWRRLHQSKKTETLLAKAARLPNCTQTTLRKWRWVLDVVPEPARVLVIYYLQMKCPQEEKLTVNTLLHQKHRPIRTTTMLFLRRKSKFAATIFRNFGRQWGPHGLLRTARAVHDVWVDDP